jgi:methylphosphotriester-DNA--protein-cysteine methyltransferase
MIFHHEINSRKLREHIRDGTVILGGNSVLKIYGTLTCRSGKRMNKKNRVFFKSEAEAVSQGLRPCGHCFRTKYNEWKNGTV